MPCSGKPYITYPCVLLSILLGKGIYQKANLSPIQVQETTSYYLYANVW